MHFSVIAFVSAALAGLTSAYTTPVGATPSGNPLSTPGLNQVVPVGAPFTITWNPTTPGTVTLVLLRGPSTNVIPLTPIVEKIPNTGTYVWTPDTNLQPDVTHYGIQLIDDQTGAYQYTDQFGISNPSVAASSLTTTTSTTITGSAISQTSSALSSSVATISASSSALIPGSPTYSANSTATVTYLTSTATAPLSTFATGTVSYSNTTVIQPTATISGSLSTVAAASPSVFTGVAGRLARNAGVALMGLGAVIVFVF